MKVSIIHKNNVALGPIEWEYGFILSNLKRMGVDSDIPLFQPSSENLPIIFNSDTKLVEVEEIIPDHDDLIEVLTGPEWDISGDKAIATYGKKDYPLEYLIDAKKREVSLNRYIKEQEGLITFNHNNTDYKIRTSRENRNELLNLHNLMNDNDYYNVKLSRTEFVSLNKSQLKNIIDNINVFVQDRFNWENTTYSQISACQTIEELKNISSKE